MHRVTFEEPGTDPIDNLYARIGTDAPHLMFAGHTDVVPPGDEARWTPSAVRERDRRRRALRPRRGGHEGRDRLQDRGRARLSRASGGKPKGSISFLITGDEEGIAVNGTIKLLQWAAARGEKFDHAILGEPTNPADARRHDQDRPARLAERHADRQRHAGARRLSASSPTIRCAASSRIMGAINAEPLDNGTAHFEPSNLEFTSIDVGNKTVNLIPAEARARFNIRFNDTRTRAELRADGRAARREGRRQCNPLAIDWEPSNADVFLTTPGPFVDHDQRRGQREVTGSTPELSTTGGTSDARFIKDYCPVIEFGLLEPADAQDRRARRDGGSRRAHGDLPAHSGAVFR